MKHKIRYEFGKTILITVTFILILKFVISFPVEELRDETVRQRQAIFEPQSIADYIDSVEIAFESSTTSAKRAPYTYQTEVVTITPVITTQSPSTEIPMTEANTLKPATTTSVARQSKKRGKIWFDLKI